MEERDDATDLTVEALRSFEPGEEAADPYEETDVSDLPEWWATAIEEFEERGLRTYQPSRLRDGSVTETVVSDLEDTYDVAITFAGKNVEYGDEWQVLVEGTTVSSVGHFRSPAGYSVFDIDRDTLEWSVRDHLRP